MSILDEGIRCLKCKKPRCSQFCPVSTPIPDVVNNFLEGNIMEAGRILFENNPLSAITSVVCPHENNCYGHCVLGAKGAPIEFYKIEQYISQLYLDAVKLTPPPSNGIRVAVIGAGPAGIYASIRLALKGYYVTLFESKEKIGGVLRFGIPDFRLPNTIVDKYARILNDLGVHFKPNTFVGATTMLTDLFDDGYKAVFVAVGTAKPNRLGLLGENLGHVCYAVDFLRSPLSYNLGKNIVVIGAGNVAVDAARMAIRCAPGSDVIMMNNLDEEDMTGTKHELEMARIDGVKFVQLRSTLRIREKDILAVRVEKTVNEDGSKSYEEEMGNREYIPADNVIIAVGQGPQGAVLSETKVTRTARGLVDVDEEGNTSIPGVFAAGDVVTGPKTVVQAIASAREICDRIEKYCEEN